VINSPIPTPQHVPNVRNNLHFVVFSLNILFFSTIVHLLNKSTHMVQMISVSLPFLFNSLIYQVSGCCFSPLSHQHTLQLSQWCSFAHTHRLLSVSLISILFKKHNLYSRLQFSCCPTNEREYMSLCLV
jgi:hypothetical protein